MHILRHKSIISFLLIAVTCVLMLAGNIQAGDIEPGNWRVNNWRNNAATAQVSTIKTPQNEAAVRILFRGKGGPNVISPSVEKIAATWPDQYGSVSFYCLGDGSMQTIKVCFLVGAHTYQGTFVLSHTGWKYITLSGLWAKKGSPPLTPKAINAYYISATGDCDVAIGLPNFQAPAVAITLARGAQGFAVRTNTPPVIDGKLDEAFWANIPELPTQYALRDGSLASSAKARVRFAFDEENLYMAAVIEQDPGTMNLGPNLTGPNAKIWSDESLEVFLNPGSDIRTSYQIIVNRLNTAIQFATRFNQIADTFIIDNAWTWPGLTTATVNGPEQWVTEWRIPWAAIGAKGPSPQINLQLMHNDFNNAGGKSSFSHSCWSPASIKPMSLYGVLDLVDAAPAVKNEIAITHLQMDRLEQNKYRLEADITQTENETQPLGKLAATITLAGPEGQSLVWERDIDAGKAASFKFVTELESDAMLSGLHRVRLALKSADDSNSAIRSAMVQYTQDIPVHVTYGELVLCPAPKKLVTAQGSFALAASDIISIPADATERTRKTAGYLAQRLYAHFGVTPEIAPNNNNARIQLKIDPHAVTEAAGIKKVDEAYLLKITPDALTITAGGEAGLFYAVITLNQIARASHLSHSPLQALSIIDWPSTHERIYNERLTTSTRDVVKQAPTIESYKQTILQNVVGSKFNVMVLTFDRNFDYQTHPMLTRLPIFNAKTLREFCDWANDHFIEVVPAMIYGSHSGWVTQNGYAHLQEDGYSVDQLDATHPEFNKIMQDLFGELLDATGPQTKRFMSWNDEWWHRNIKTPSIIHNGLTRQEIFKNAIMAQHDFLKSRGVKMMMFTDMIDPNHNGKAPFELHKVANELPRDIIMCSWSGTSPELFTKMGFTTYKINNNFTVPPRNLSDYINGFGTIVYWHGHTMFSYTTDASNAGYAWHTTLRAAEYAWNIGSDSNLPTKDWVKIRMPNLMATYGDVDVPLASNDAPVSVKLPAPSANPNYVALSEKLKLEEIGHLKTTAKVGLVEMPITPVLVGTDGLTVAFEKPVDAASILVLQSLMFKDENAMKAARKLALRFVYVNIPVGQLTMTYEDQSTYVIELGLGRNIINSNAPSANRYIMLNARDVYPLQLNQGQVLVQSQWVNPNPQKKIVSVSLQAKYEEMPLLLGAISYRPLNANARLASASNSAPGQSAK